VRFQLGCHGGGEGIAVDGEGATGGKAVFLGHFHHEAACGAHLPMEKADGVLFVVVRAEGVGADHLGKVAGAVGEGADLGPHLVDDDGDARVCSGPGGFGACHATADDVKGFGHGPDLGRIGGKGKPGATVRPR
jgi:hypothetical protein